MTALDNRPDTDAGRRPVRRVGAPLEREARHGLPSRSMIVALVLACVTLMVVDKAGGADSPVAAARRTAGEVLGPVEAGVSALVGPIAALPGALRTNDSLRADVAELEELNADLRRELRTDAYDDNRVADLRGLCAIAGDLGYALTAARVIAIGGAQSFSDTVTIDAGSDSGLHPDMTVLNRDGLVGRVTSVTSHTATVLLAVDPESTVGGRVGDSMELGFVHGRGEAGDDGRLDLQLADRSVIPEQGQPVVTWGSEGGAPYVAGVPIGSVSRVYESLRDTSYRAVLEPYVDFTSLDLVGVVVPSGSTHAVIEADGSCG
ncbi:rod shape-determining protein MreC [Nocardioides thalensis]|uniref:Cell shape-determining protein MreC n=1 Tax=Nocardioides thalensis TaxID=1914755 RepID=A0A853C6L5_9ACTN|nr:rod shape-determining protein MreC [Nocardioides thalensis]NYJ02322.1 rod shape-determining protein MreC [Nocardioides thalensis]